MRILMYNTFRSLTASHLSPKTLRMHLSAFKLFDSPSNYLAPDTVKTTPLFVGISL